MSGLKVIGGESVSLNDRRGEVLEHLRSIMARVESGEIQCNKFAMILVDSEVDNFTASTHYDARATEVLGLLEVMKEFVMRDILE